MTEAEPAVSGDRGTDSMASPPVRLPLNSRRLTAAQIKRLGRALDLPTSASVEEVRQMIDGKLETLERHPNDVQVVIESSGTMALHDEGGEFLQIPVEDVTDEHGETSPSDRDVSSPSASAVDTLRASLQQANEEITALKAEISTLNCVTVRHE